MLSFIINNGSSIIVGLLVVILVAGIAAKMIRDKLQHKSSCGCGCESCPSSSSCHTK